MVGYAYSATKAAVINLVRQAAMDLARFNVLINGIAPGPFRTNIGGGRMQNVTTERDFADSLPLGGSAIPRRSRVRHFCWLPRPRVSWTGAIIPVDGGRVNLVRMP